MTSYLEQIVMTMQDVAPLMTKGLAELRNRDKTTRDLLKAINKEENDLLEELKTLAKSDPQFDEEPLKARAQQLIARRQEATLLLEEQNKFAAGIYHHLDEKIKGFDTATKAVAHLFPDGGASLEGAAGDEARKKKKRKATGKGGAAHEGEESQEYSIFEINEPKYCKCKRVSFGQMIACENPDCQIEWFHFECVGLKEEPVDPWFCPSCREPQPKKEKAPKKKKDKAAEGGDTAGAGTDNGAGAGAGAGADATSADAGSTGADTGATEGVTEAVAAAVVEPKQEGEGEESEEAQQNKKHKIGGESGAEPRVIVVSGQVAAEGVGEGLKSDYGASGEAADSTAVAATVAATASATSTSEMAGDVTVHGDSRSADAESVRPAEPNISSSSSDATATATTAMDVVGEDAPQNIVLDSAAVDNETAQSHSEPAPQPQQPEHEHQAQEKSLEVSEPVSVPAPVIIAEPAEHQEAVGSESSGGQTTVNDEHNQSAAVDVPTATDVNAAVSEADAVMEAVDGGDQSSSVSVSVSAPLEHTEAPHSEGDAHNNTSSINYANVVSGSASVSAYESIASITNESMNGGDDIDSTGNGPRGGLQPL